MVVHCLFEQSGTFKNEFKKLDINSFDYDISNKFGQTDFVCDLFLEIEKCFDGKNSIFDNILRDDLVLAFFPCTYFECQNQLSFTCNNFGMKNWSDYDKVMFSIARHNKLHNNFVILDKLVCIALEKGFKLVIENPYTQPHYLTLYWCFKPAIIDLDRRLNGDYFKKPTQYFFFNFKPYNNLVFECLDYLPSKTICNCSHGIERSLISSQYANRFIRQYLIEYDCCNNGGCYGPS